MISVGSLIAVVVVAAAALGIGLLIPYFRRTPEHSASYGVVLAGITGLLILFLGLLFIQTLGIRWSRGVVVAAMLLAVAAAAGLRRRWPAPPRFATRPDGFTWRWGDGTAIAIVAIFAVLALSLWITTPDFVYHWGLKGERFFADGRIDYADLAQRWNEPIHPDYPNVLPTLYAASAALAGAFQPGALMLWSAFFFALLLLGGREALRAGGCSPGVRQAGLALVALAIGAFAIGSLMAGGADWLVAIAAVGSIPALVRPATRETTRQLGIFAALAAAGKVEGVILAGILIAVQGVRLGRSLREPRCALELLAPAAAVALPWQATVRVFHLFQEFNAGRLDLGRWSRVAPELLANLGQPSWHGFAWTLLLIPLLALERRLRPLAAVLALQVSFYVYVYMSVRIEPIPLIQASFPRLVFQVLPAVLIGLLVAAFGQTAAEGEPSAERSPALLLDGSGSPS